MYDYIKARLTERSTWAGFGVVISGTITTAAVVGGWTIPQWVIVANVAVGFIAVLMPTGGGQDG